jgi:hypothetical protein
MLNELWQLSNSLELAGIKSKDWHQNLNPLPKATRNNPCFHICISDEGRVYSINILDIELVSRLRKLEYGYGNSIPGFNIPSIYHITDKGHINTLKKWRNGKEELDLNTLRSWCSPNNNSWDNKINKKLQSCFGYATEKLSSVVGNSSRDLSTLIERIKMFSNFDSVGTNQNFARAYGFRVVLENYLFNTVQSRDELKHLLQILIHWNKENFQVFLDIHRYNDFPIANVETIELINDRLMNNNNLPDECNRYDAFGLPMLDKNEKLPKITLPAIGKVGLKSMNGESKCQCRYGKVDADSFPIGRESMRRIKGALEWIGDRERKEETWISIGEKGREELLFVYPSILPEVSHKLASCFGISMVDDGELRFEDAASKAIKSFKRGYNNLNGVDLRIFSIREMDRGRRGINFNRCYTVQHLERSISEWQLGCTNIPEIVLKSFNSDKKDKKMVDVLLKVPSPTSTIKYINSIWRMDGKTVSKTLISKTEGVELLFDKSFMVPRLLSTFIQNSKNLFLFMGNALNSSNFIACKSYNKDQRFMPSIMGLLIYKMGIKKEYYMEGVPFLIGRIFKLADKIHGIYHEVVNKKLPNRLIGNMLMRSALNNPAQALACLTERFGLYYNWANTYCGEWAGLARYFVKLCEDESLKLYNMDIPSSFNDVEKAQLLIGYLAWIPKKDPNVENKSSENSKEE